MSKSSVSALFRFLRLKNADVRIKKLWEIHNIQDTVIYKEVSAVTAQQIMLKGQRWTKYSKYSYSKGLVLVHILVK